MLLSTLISCLCHLPNSQEEELYEPPTYGPSGGLLLPPPGCHEDHTLHYQIYGDNVYHYQKDHLNFSVHFYHFFSVNKKDYAADLSRASGLNEYHQTHEGLTKNITSQEASFGNLMTSQHCLLCPRGFPTLWKLIIKSYILM